MIGRWVIALESLALVCILAYFAFRTEPTPVGFEVGRRSDLASYARLERALEKRVECDVKQTPLLQVLEQLAAKVGISIVIDEKALEDASIRPNTPVTCKVSGVTLRSALRLMLSRLDLTWRFKDESLMVTTPEVGQNEQVVMVYPVRDLVMTRSKDAMGFDYNSLVDLISTTIAPQSWPEVGGPAMIFKNTSTGTLVFPQTREVHAQVAALLTALRKARDAQNIRPGDTVTSDRPHPFPQLLPGPGDVPPRSPGSSQPAAGSAKPTNGQGFY